jgi:hypothetical protein
VASGFTFVDQNLDELSNREEKLELKVRSDATLTVCFACPSLKTNHPYLHPRRLSPFTCRFSSGNSASTARRSTCAPASPVRNEPRLSFRFRSSPGRPRCCNPLTPQNAP